MNRTEAALFLVFFLLARSPDPARAQNWDAIPVTVKEVRGGVHMISAAGGNLAVFVGEDGTFVVDSDYAEMAERVLRAVRGIADSARANPRIRWLVNTHWHFDHVGGNEAFAVAGASIITHENVLAALSTTRVMKALEGTVIEPAPAKARPRLTFGDRFDLTWNGDVIHLIHVPGAHSDGDVVVHFQAADVVHVGDLFFNGLYPYIDVDFGGNLEGIVRGLEDVLARSGEGTLFIPGHGPLATRHDLETYVGVMRTVAERVRRMVDRGLSRDEVVAAKPTAEFDARWAQPQGFAQPGVWVGLVYDGMVRADAAGGNPKAPHLEIDTHTTSGGANEVDSAAVLGRRSVAPLALGGTGSDRR